MTVINKETPPQQKRPPTTKVVKAKKKRQHYKCCMRGGLCEGSSDGKWTRVPPFPEAVEPGDSEATRITKGKKRFRRQEWLRRASRDENEQTKGLRVCSKHDFVWLRKSFPYEPEKPEFDEEGRPKKKSKTTSFLVPDSAGIKIAPTTVNKGLAPDRLKAKILSKVDKKDWEMATQNKSEIAENPNIEDINENVLKASGLDVHCRPYSPDTVQQPNLCTNCQCEFDPNTEAFPGNLEDRPATPKAKDREPTVNPNFIDDNEIRARTGFLSLFVMLAFVMVVCNGDVNVALETTTELTWFEEWLAFFQWLWGRESVTDESLAKRFDIGRTALGRILEHKRQMVLASRLRWPMFASYEEDFALRDKRWNGKYAGKRPIMWDDTNVGAPDPQDAETNRHWFSYYYDSCVAKGAVFLQLCGWMGTWELWAGCISDSDYQVRAGVLVALEQFVKECSLHSDIPFTLILDKGYRIVLAAWRAGRQLTLQPDFAKSDRRFTSREVLRSAAVASDRSGNERAVNVAKRAGRISRGLQPHQQPRIIADSWSAWGFQANFMYKRVL